MPNQPFLHYWADGETGRLQLEIMLEDAQSGSHQGNCLADVQALRRVDYIRAQLDAMDPEAVREHLRGYGAWEDEDLEDDDQNLTRTLWLACGDIVEEAASGDHG